jgi:putative holliday junction resolvase
MSHAYTFLAFDFGMKSIGVAVGQTITDSAAPLHVLKAKIGLPDWKQVEKLIDTWKPKALIVGLPLNMDGTEQPMTLHAKKFAKRLEARFQCPVHLVDERLTTWEAKNNAPPKTPPKMLHSQAARIILEQWLRSQ